MSDTQVKALLATLEAQRNNALNGLANSQADLAVANERILELTQQLEKALLAATQAIELAKQAPAIATTDVPADLLA